MGCAPRCRKKAPRACTVKTFVGSLGWESGHHNPIQARCSPKWVYPANVEFLGMRDKWVWRNFADFAPLIAYLPSGKVNHPLPALALQSPSPEAELELS